jgi:hypothetical protein
MYQEVREKIKVLALFDQGKITPKAFKWSGREFRIAKIALAYQERSGRTVYYFFGVECKNGSVFKLKYNNEKLIWNLEERWVE